MPKITEPSFEDIKSRRPEALSRLVEMHTPALLAGALGLGFPPSEAEELVQDTFVAFLSALERFEGRSQVKTYLFGILYNKALELRRRQGREETTDEIEKIVDSRFDSRGHWTRPPKGPEDEARISELGRMINDCAGGLGIKERAAFYLKEGERQSTEHICNMLGISPTYLGVLLFRARNKLRECLEGTMNG